MNIKFEKLIHHKKADSTGGYFTMTASYVKEDLDKWTAAQLLKELTRKMADRIAEEVYPEVLKGLDKELLVKEVSVKVSEHVLSRIFNSGEK